MPRDGKYAVAKQIRDQEKPQAIFVNSRGQASFNPPSYRALESCNQPPAGLFAAFDKINDRLWACDLVAKGTDGAVVLQRSKNNKTARCSFGAVLAERPDLKVEAGRQRKIPWYIDKAENRFILQLDLEENIPAPKRGKKKVSLTEVHPSKLEDL
ncbi:MAG TPA: hypothetical protein VK191_09020 [Symbiobacteriaceae bacterium]|nr:hypothetical protein [Symbiobacteriaceae bacterium]